MYTSFMIHIIASIASILKIRLGVDFNLDDDTIKVHFTSLLIELLTHKLSVSF